jgi:hypothetical protein
MTLAPAMRSSEDGSIGAVAAGSFDAAALSQDLADGGRMSPKSFEVDYFIHCAVCESTFGAKQAEVPHCRLVGH